MFILGLPCGSTHQVSSLPRPVQLLPNQAVLHFKHSHNFAGKCLKFLLSFVSFENDNLCWPVTVNSLVHSCSTEPKGKRHWQQWIWFSF